MKVQLEFEFDRKWDSLEEVTVHAVHTSRVPLKYLAGECNLSPAGLSKRLNLHPDENDPRITLKIFERILEVTQDFRPIYYLVDKFIRKDEEKILAEFREFKKMLPEIKRFCDMLEGPTPDERRR